MAELTIEQKRAIAVASARLRLGQQPAPNPNQAILDQQAAQFPTAAEGGTPPQSMGDKILGMLPTPRTATRVGGAIIGGAAGAYLGPPGIAVGGAFGGAGGEAAYQTVQQLRGQQQGADFGGLSEAALQGAAQEGIPAVIAAKVPGMLQRGSEEAVGRIVKTGTEAEKAAVRKVAGEVIPAVRPTTTTSRVLEKFTTHLNEAGRVLEREYSNVPASLKLKSAPMKNALIGMRNKLFVNGQLPPGAKAQVDAYSELIDWFAANPNLRVADLRKNKQIWDNLVNYARRPGAAEPVKEEVYQAGANLIRSAIGSMFPKIADANRQVHVWKTVVDAVGRADTKAFGRMSSHAMDIPFGIMGGALGNAFGGAQGAGAGAAAGIALREFTASPLWQTMSVPMRQAVKSLLESGNTQAAMRLISAATMAQAPKSGDKARMSVEP